MTDYANRGKEAEGLVKKHLAKLSTQSDFTFYRFPDARAGSLQTAPADFMLLHKGQLILLEVKQVEHSYRLPHQNLTQTPKLVRYEMAGASCYVLVYFKPDKVWRFARVDYFTEKEGGSWDMRDLPVRTLEQAIGEL